MALAIGVAPRDKIYIDDMPVQVVEVHGYTFALLKVNGKIVKVDDQTMIEVLPSVFISCGKPSESVINNHTDAVKKAHEEWDRRKKALESGTMSQDEYDALPKLDLAQQLLPRLLIDAPRNIRILRGELYDRQRRVRHQAKA